MTERRYFYVKRKRPENDPYVDEEWTSVEEIRGDENPLTVGIERYERLGSCSVYDDIIYIEDVIEYDENFKLLVREAFESNKLEKIVGEETWKRFLRRLINENFKLLVREAFGSNKLKEIVGEETWEMFLGTLLGRLE